MTPHGRWHRALVPCLLAAAGLAAPGCMGCLHPVEPLTPETRTACKAYPSCCRDHVYVILIHGMDPLDYANLQGVRDYVQELGFRKTFYGQCYHTAKFAKEMHRIHAEDPDSRFVLIGFSFGANMARYLANVAKDDGIPIDLLVYFGGNTLKNEAYDQPDNVARVVNILASGAIWNGAWMDRAENIHEPDVYHFGTPSHPYSVELLTHELGEVASRVPVVEDGPPPPPAEGEWDFLKPVSRLKPVR
jgi:hypothetical protein